MKKGKQELWSCVDLRPFDLAKPDFGVKEYLRKSRATGVVFLNFYVDFVHTHREIDDTPLHDMCTANRGMPWPQTWTRTDFAHLVKQLQMNGVLVYIGFLAATKSDRWQAEIPWVKDHPQLYQTTRHGQRLWGHSINPLKHIEPNRLYEDLLVEDLQKVLEAYGFDGVCLGDGMLGLRGPRETMEDWDFSEDMVEQFSKKMHVEVPDQDSAGFILEHHRGSWAEFWCLRWEEFVSKLAEITVHCRKGLMALDAWSRHPIDLYWEFGIDYQRLGKMGLEKVMVQAREANKWRKHKEGPYAVEGAMIGTFLSHKLHAPDVSFYWAMATVNAPELWDAVLDLPNVLERESIAYLTLSIYENDGWKAIVDGVCLIWGNMARDEDWLWCHRLWDKSYQIVEEACEPLGGVLTHGSFSWDVQEHSLPRSLSNYIDDGFPLHAACREEHLAEAQKNSRWKKTWVTTHDSTSKTLNDEHGRQSASSAGSQKTNTIGCMDPLLDFRSSSGRLRGWANTDNTVLVSVENQDNLFYQETEVTIPGTVFEVRCHAPREHYLVTQSEHANKFRVSVPPDGVLICSALLCCDSK